MESHVSEQKELRRHTKWFHMDDFIYQIVHIQSPRNSPDITAKIPEKLFEAEIFQSVGEKHFNLKNRKHQDELCSLSFGNFLFSWRIF